MTFHIAVSISICKEGAPCPQKTVHMVTFDDIQLQEDQAHGIVNHAVEQFIDTGIFGVYKEEFPMLVNPSSIPN